jgi:hypothetical protein
MQHLLKLQVLVPNFEELIFGILSTSVAESSIMTSSIPSCGFSAPQD